MPADDADFQVRPKEMESNSPRVNHTEAFGSPRETRVIAGGLAAVATLSWGYLCYHTWAMQHMDMDLVAMAMPSIGAWGTADLAFVFGMWVVMMVAMMLPSATPTVVLYARVHRQRGAAALGVAWIFAAGYVAAWSGFSLLASLLQWGMHETALKLPATVSAAPSLGAGLLVGAGLYQFTSYKDTCLKHCVSPLGFLLTHWREGTSGAWVMGFCHGLYCTGCCWALMATMFALGVMNVAWAIVLAGIVALEKLVPTIRRPTGWALIVWGIWMLQH